MPSNNPPNPDPDPQDKDAWVDIGNELEHEFVDTVAPRLGLDAEINPVKEGHDGNEYAIDLIVDDKHTDLKCQATPFFMAKELFGIDSQYAVSFNVNDYERYKKKIQNVGGIDILFWVTWPDEKSHGTSIDAMEGIWKVSMAEIIVMVEHQNALINDYNNREKGTRNAKDSYMLDLRQMTPLMRDGVRYFDQEALESVTGVSEGEFYCFPEYIARIEDVSLSESYREDRFWKYPSGESQSLEEEVTITYTKHPFVRTQADAPSVDVESQTTSEVSAAGWESLDQSLDFTKVELPQSPSAAPSSGD